MYIKNRRNSNKIMGFGSFQTLCLTESLVLRIAYFSYTKRCKQFKKNPKSEIISKKNID